ncbi:hypothetical protein ACOSQ2_030506 [Xanthoceras sorbifolium]
MWKDIDTFTSNVTARILEFNQTYGRQIAELKDKVKEMLMAPINDPAEKVNLINLLNRLGVSYHFRAEIEEHLNHIFEAQPNIPEDNDYDLYTIALFFRVLKQHGYKLSYRSPIHLTDRIHSLTYGVTSRAAFGKRYNEQESVVPIVIESTKLASGFSVADLFPSIEGLLQWKSGIRPQLEKMHQEADIILENIISEHKKAKATLDPAGNREKNEDLVDVLLKFQEQDDTDQFHLTTDNIKAVLWDVFSASGEASATIIDWALSELMKNPRVMTKAQAEIREVFNRNNKVDETGINEMKFLKLVIKETLRLHPPSPLLAPRECQERCEINGFDIPKKIRVFVNAWAIGRDPKYWSEPENFIPERFLDSPIDYKGKDFEYIPFGAGRRICPGMSFGLANVELPLAMLLYHFDWKLPNGMKNEDLNMTETFGIVVRRKKELYIVPYPYCPSFAA